MLFVARTTIYLAHFCTPSLNLSYDDIKIDCDYLYIDIKIVCTLVI